MSEDTLKFPTEGQTQATPITPQQPSPAAVATQAKAAIAQEKAIRRQRCLEKIAKALDEEKCSLNCEMLLRAGSVEPRVDIVPKDLE